MELTTLVVLAVVFVATFIRSALGFGEALVAVPLLALAMPVEVATPLAVLVSISVAGIVIAQDWRKVHFRSAGWLVISSLPGIPLGLVLLTGVDEWLVKIVLGAVIIAFSTFCLLRRHHGILMTDHWAWAFGFLSGILGGAYGMNGPPLVVYGSLRNWSPEHFRATLQGYFLPASLLGMVGYWWSGLWVSEVTSYYLLSLPMTVAAIFLGRMAHRRLPARRFLLLVHAGLLGIGITLGIQALWQPAP